MNRRVQCISKGKEHKKYEFGSKYGAEMTCPVTTGIFVRIAAEAAYEEFQQGMPIEKITPFWKVISETSPAARKLTFGTEFLNKLRLDEGLTEI